MADELLAARRAKLERLRADGIEPYPHEFPGVEPVAGVLVAHADLADGEETDARHRVTASARDPPVRAPRCAVRSG